MGTVEMMARYNRWQNEALFASVGALSDDARRADRGAFFGSIHETLSHILWGDTGWMSRFDGWTPADVGIAESGRWITDWEVLVARRALADADILDWAGRVSEEELAGDISFRSSIVGQVTRPYGPCVTHFFNHQTHHRGQVHAMVTAAGGQDWVSDLFLMPSEQ